MAITTLNLRALNRSDTASSGQVVTATSATAMDFQAAVGGKIGQVVHVVKNDSFSTSTGETWTDVTGLSVTITPSASSSKILVHAAIINTGADWHAWKIVDGSGSDIADFIGDANGSRGRTTSGGVYHQRVDHSFSTPAICLDAPSSTDAQTYKVQVWGNGSGTASYINRSKNYTDNDYDPTGISTICAMEVLA